MNPFKCFTTLTFLFLFISLVNVQAQQQYFIPTHYHGIFSDQRTSVRAQSLGNSVITLDGVGQFIYNPASIGPGNEKADVHLNYLNQHPFEGPSHYPFLGVSYRITSNLSAGASYFSWISTSEIWRSVVGGDAFDRDGLKSQEMATVGVSYQVIENLHVGLSGNFMRGRAVRGVVTSSDFLMTLGAIYDKPVELIRSEWAARQKIRVAGSFINLLLNNKTEQTLENSISNRELPVHARVGGAYSLSIPVNVNFGEETAYFRDTRSDVDLSVHLHIKRALDGPDPVLDSVDNGFGFGIESIFRERISLQMGYFSETRAEESEGSSAVFGTSDKKSGFTWGLGTTVPVDNLFEADIPFTVDVYLTFSKMMNELDDRRRHPDAFGDDKRQFGLGINLKWN
jgi:hypothetical protein